MKIIKAPERPDWSMENSIFLAGSIEMGKARKWQDDATFLFETTLDDQVKEVTQILNPRRDDWDSSWEQKYENPHFNQQVRWELSCLDRANWILMYFDPGTVSAISLLELGSFKYSSLVVVCPEGYFRKGNVDIFCDVFNVTQKDSLKEAVQHISKHIKL